MTISAEKHGITSGRKSRLRKVVFTQTVAGAAGNATTAFTITGKLLRVETSGGDGAWDFTLNDGITNVFAITGINVAGTANSWPLYMTAAGGVSGGATTAIVHGIPMVEQTLLCTIANGGTTAAVITVIWEESDIFYA